MSTDTDPAYIFKNLLSFPSQCSLLELFLVEYVSLHYDPENVIPEKKQISNIILSSDSPEE